jgi:hypothetical protein
LKAHLGALKAYPGAMEVYPAHVHGCLLQSHRQVNAHLLALEFSLEYWRLTLKPWRFNMETESLILEPWRDCPEITEAYHWSLQGFPCGYGAVEKDKIN